MTVGPSRTSDVDNLAKVLDAAFSLGTSGYLSMSSKDSKFWLGDLENFSSHSSSVFFDHSWESLSFLGMSHITEFRLAMHIRARLGRLCHSSSMNVSGPTLVKLQKHILVSAGCRHKDGQM
jgi:hypothetical protein